MGPVIDVMMSELLCSFILISIKHLLVVLGG
jgi:hypothetical protein